jgi:hypothetical protein
LGAKKPESSFDHVGCETHSSFNTDRHMSSRPEQVTLSSYQTPKNTPKSSNTSLQNKTRGTHRRRQLPITPVPNA